MDAESMSELGPLYSDKVIESCATVDEYCFLCASVDDGEDGEAASIRTFVTELVRQHKELNHIVASVDDIYRNEICGDTPWSTDSIRRHLLFSTEFVGLFHGVVDQVSPSPVRNHRFVNNLPPLPSAIVVSSTRFSPTRPQHLASFGPAPPSRPQ